VSSDKAENLAGGGSLYRQLPIQTISISGACGVRSGRNDLEREQTGRSEYQGRMKREADPSS
jgi:hypothetical protein